MSERTDFFIRGRELLAEPYHYLASGLDNIFLINGVTEEITDYGPMVRIENINGLHHAIGLHIIEKDGPMEGVEFRFLRKQMQLSQADLAKYLGVTDQTVANYEKGKSGKQGLGPADAAMRTFYLLKVVPKATRVEAIKRFIDAPMQNARLKLSDVPRQKMVECWLEGDDGKIAA